MNVSPKRTAEESGSENSPPVRSRGRKTIDIVRSNLESLKFELSQGSAVDPEAVREMEERIKELEDQGDIPRKS